ncbi:hypothetical protein TNCV_3877061 [Trichonephila clavipes]|uniref:Uncharacterized protein n=1 Tax=Trichonephila clavipes TaxID=2585209 RepID=A0A8X6SWN6_TRICX|nr:hypothetical protein TNCV_3877061 [Trichonephila clavipes]
MPFAVQWTVTNISASLDNLALIEKETLETIVFAVIRCQHRGINVMIWSTLHLSPIEIIWSWVAGRLAHHPSPTSKVDKVCHRLESALNMLPIFVIQVQFDPMYKVILPAGRGSYFF